jgi:hypothetical protein
MVEKMLEYEYNGVKYSHKPLEFEKLTDFGLSIMQKVAATGSVVACVIGQRLVKDELYSFQRCILECFNPEDFKWLIEEFIYNPEACLYINGTPVTAQEAGEHFSGNFMLLYAVVFNFAVQCVGEPDALIQSFSASFKNIGNSLKEIWETQISRAEQSLNMFAQSQKETRVQGKRKSR